MAKYRNNLPQLSNDFFLTDGGLETTLIFHEGIDLPDFAAFHLLKDEAGCEALRNYFRTYAQIASDYEVGFILESATWRASSDWGRRLGYTESELIDANRKAIDLLSQIRGEFENEKTKMVISACVGPRGDGYSPANMMTADEAENYHANQIAVFKDTNADMVAAMTINYAEEAIGIAHAAKTFDMPVAISFTVETDGKLPTGQTLKEAIESVDKTTTSYPVYYMINCAHPTHFENALDESERWTKRIRSIRANSSIKSHEELNESAELDIGNPAELGQQYKKLLSRFQNITVLGGCCGTDHRHVEEICKATVRSK